MPNKISTKVPKKTPDAGKLNEISKKAEHDLSTYQSKTGTGPDHPKNIEDSASRITSKFPGSSVKFGEDVVTSASLNRRIPPGEGGELDEHNRYFLFLPPQHTDNAKKRS